MHPSYFSAVLDAETPSGGFPDAWAIVTAHAPMRRGLSFAENAAADVKLRRRLVSAGFRHWRVTGRSASGDHAEPGWGFVASLDAAKAIGREFSQEAVFWVQHGELRVCDCAPAAMLLRVGPLGPRLNPVATDVFPGRERLAALFPDAPDKFAALLRFLGESSARHIHFEELLSGVNESSFTFADWCEAAAEFQNRLEVAGRPSPFDKKNGYLHCCAEALLSSPPGFRLSLLAGFDDMWVKYGYEG